MIKTGLDGLLGNMRVPTVRDPGAQIWVLTGDHWGPALNQAIEGAQESVLISLFLLSHHWRKRPGQRLDLLSTLSRAATRGVKCRCILATAEPLKYRKPLNVEAAEQLENAGWRVRWISGARVLHEKIVIIDSKLVLVGSHNISRASAVENYDTTLLVNSKDLAGIMGIQFWQRWRIAEERAK